jgi:hypothetical protein
VKPGRDQSMSGLLDVIVESHTFDAHADVSKCYEGGNLPPPKMRAKRTGLARARLSAELLRWA